MKKNESTEKIRLKMVYRLCCVLAVIILLIVLSGCSQHTYFAYNKKMLVGEIEELIGEQHVNKKFQLAKPMLKSHQWIPIDGSINLVIQQKKHVEYDLQTNKKIFKIYKKISLIDSKHHPAVALGTMLVFPAFMTDDANKSRNEAMDKWAINELISGKNQVTTTQKRMMGEYLNQNSYLYTKELDRDESVIKAENLEFSEMVKASTLPIKVKQQTTGDELLGTIDVGGTANIKICNNFKESLLLASTDFDVFAEWRGNWVLLGKTTLTNDLIAQTVYNFQRKNMALVGIPKLPPFAKLRIKIPDGEVKADTDCEVSLTVENTGKGEFYKLVATSESLVSELDGLRFEFGKLVPGDSLTLTKKVHIPRGQSTGPADMNFKWSELNGYEPNPMHARIMVKGLPRPQFAVSVQVLDDNTGNSVGNGDGRIQKGEAVDLLVTVKNIGDGAARDAKVTIDDISVKGVIVNKSEQSLGEILVGQSKQARLTITTKKSAKIDKLTPIIRVIDQYLDIEQKEQLTLALESELAPSIMAYKTTIYVGEEEVAIRGGAGDETAIIARAKPGSSLQATGELGQWMRVELPRIGAGWVHRSGVAFEPTVQLAVAAQASSGIVEILQKAPPLIAVAKPLGNSKFNSSHIEVSGVIADDQSVNRTVFKLNGREITFDDKRAIGIEAGGRNSAQRELNFAFPVELAVGENEIEIIAWDNEGLRSSKVILVSYEKEKGNIYVACIGIDKYKNVPRLKYATADARAMAQYLQKSLSVPDENMYVLLNEQATLTNIKNTLGVKIRQRANKSDMVIIYFSGHGAPEADPYSPDDDGVSKYLLPIDAQMDALYATALPMDEVRNIFRRLISERVIFMADTCYSGAAGGRTLMPSGTQYRSVNQDNLLARLRDTGKGRVILTASQGSEVSQEKDELGHGVFTYYLLRGLDGEADRNGDHTITISELYEYVSKEVPKATKNTQHPMIKLDEMVGEVVISVLERK